LEAVLLFKQSNGTQSTITSLTVAPKGRLIACGTLDGRVLLVDTRHGKQKKSFGGHEGAVTAVAFLPDGKHIVSSSWDQTTQRWSRTGREEPIRLRHGTEVKALAVSAEASKGAAGARDGEVKIFSLTSLKCTKNLQAHDSDISGLAFSDDGRFLVTTSWDGTCKVWDTSKFEETSPVVHQNERLRSLAIADDPPRAFLGLHGGRILVVDLDSPGEPAELVGHEDVVSSLTVSPSGDLLVSGSWDRTIRTWSLDDLSEVSTDSLLTGVTSLVWSPKGDRLYSSDFSGKILVWHR